MKLDGIPHALELAATQLAVVTPAELDELLTERFRLLSDHSSARREHQRTLKATVDWSFDLLDDREQNVLTNLSVFAGACDRPSIAAVAGCDAVEVIAILARLVQHSLVHASPHGDALRYRVLETVRTYGAERLAEKGTLEASRAAHSRWYRDRNESAHAALRTPAELEWVERISLDLPDIRAALGTAIAAGDTDRAARIVGALSPFEVIRWSEVSRWAGEVLALPDPAEHPLAVVLYSQWAWAAHLDADDATVAARCREGLAIAERRRCEPWRSHLGVARERVVAQLGLEVGARAHRAVGRRGAQRATTCTTSRRHCRAWPRTRSGRETPTGRSRPPRSAGCAGRRSARRRCSRTRRERWGPRSCDANPIAPASSSARRSKGRAPRAARSIACSSCAASRSSRWAWATASTRSRSTSPRSTRRSTSATSRTSA